MNTRTMKAAFLGIPSTPLPFHLGRHFLEAAEEARADRNEELAIHFIELALEAFDPAFEQHLDAAPDLSDNSGAHRSLCSGAC